MFFRVPVQNARRPLRGVGGSLAAGRGSGARHWQTVTIMMTVSEAQAPRAREGQAPGPAAAVAASALKRRRDLTGRPALTSESCCD